MLKLCSGSDKCDGNSYDQLWLILNDVHSNVSSRPPISTYQIHGSKCPDNELIVSQLTHQPGSFQLYRELPPSIYN